MGDHSPEPVDETMSNFIVRTSKKYILFVCLVMYLKVRQL